MSLYHELLALGLPLAPENVFDASNAVERCLGSAGVDPADTPVAMRQLAEDWRRTGTASSLLRRVIAVAITVGAPSLESRFAEAYTYVHSDLRTREQLTFRDATAALALAPVVASLATIGTMSAPRISGYLSDSLAPGVVARLLKAMGHTAGVDAALIEELLDDEADAEPQILADAALSDAAKHIAAKAAALGYRGNLAEQLLVLCDDEMDTFAPYLQILHYLCCIQHFVDHAMGHLYTFAPRGKTGIEVFSRYPGKLGAVGNPILNNMKAVESLDWAWARSRKDQRGRAYALVSIITEMDGLPASNRREVARDIRLWLTRIIRVASEATSPLVLTPNQVEQLCSVICERNTGTAGVLEQRFVDAAATVIHAQAGGWRARGVGDAVNTTNRSRRKLGDVDYQHPGERRIVAYEAHGGYLREAYLREHVRTLEPVLRERIETELVGVADPEEWGLTVRFIAHGFDPVDHSDVIDGVRVAIELLTFERLRTLAGREAVVDQFLVSSVPSLNERWTPQRVRDWISDLVGGGAA